MVHEDTDPQRTQKFAASPVQVVRHNQVCEKLRVSSAKLFDMVARGQFPKPFALVPGGRAVGWLEADIDRWVLDRRAACKARAGSVSNGEGASVLHAPRSSSFTPEEDV
jgi:prophage regulatory protein